MKNLFQEESQRAAETFSYFTAYLFSPDEESCHIFQIETIVTIFILFVLFCKTFMNHSTQEFLKHMKFTEDGFQGIIC